MTELNQKLTKSIPSSRRHSLWGIYTREKYLCMKFGLKEGRGHLVEGGAFLGAYDTFKKFPKALGRTISVTEYIKVWLCEVRQYLALLQWTTTSSQYQDSQNT